MAMTFAYSGRTRAGQAVTGERIADSMDAAVAALRREQVLVTQISPVKDRAARRSPGRTAADAPRQLATTTNEGTDSEGFEAMQGSPRTDIGD